MTAIRLRIHGRVQGVGYRAAMVREAKRLGVGGWVRNRLDGSVEALAAGPQSAVEALVDWAHRGPPAASVARVEIVERQAQAPFLDGFEQLPTA